MKVLMDREDDFDSYGFDHEFLNLHELERSSKSEIWNLMCRDSAIVEGEARA